MIAAESRVLLLRSSTPVDGICFANLARIIHRTRGASWNFYESAEIHPDIILAGRPSRREPPFASVPRVPSTLPVLLNTDQLNVEDDHPLRSYSE